MLVELGAIKSVKDQLLRLDGSRRQDFIHLLVFRQ